jgi:hypothetical protein
MRLHYSTWLPKTINVGSRFLYTLRRLAEDDSVRNAPTWRAHHPRSVIAEPACLDAAICASIVRREAGILRGWTRELAGGPPLDQPKTEEEKRREKKPGVLPSRALSVPLLLCKPMLGNIVAVV